MAVCQNDPSAQHTHQVSSVRNSFSAIVTFINMVGRVTEPRDTFHKQNHGAFAIESGISLPGTDLRPGGDGQTHPWRNRINSRMGNFASSRMRACILDRRYAKMIFPSDATRINEICDAA